MTTKVSKGSAFQDKIQKGINTLADTVKDTLGPLGNTVVLVDEYNRKTITKDGVTVAKSFEELEDPIEDIGASLVKDVSTKVNTLAGDGTTTATVLAQAMFNNGSKKISLGATPLEFKKGMQKATADVIENLMSSRKVIKSDSPEVMDVAMVSSNGDKKVAEIITKIYKELGPNAVISTKHGDGLETTVDLVKGMQFDRGYLATYCITDDIKMRTDFNNPYIFLYDGKISEVKQIYEALEAAGKADRPLVIVAEEVIESALRALVVNHVSGNVKSAIVQTPGYGKKRLERLEDMGILFGGQVIDKDFNMETFTSDMLGEAEKAEITSETTAFVGGAGKIENIEARVAHIKSKLEHFKNNDYQAKFLEERLGKLTSGVSVIKVGAYSNEEAREMLDRVDDCKFAVKAALEEGIIDGGGVSFLFASSFLEAKMEKRLKEESESFKEGYKSLLESIKSPFRQVLSNAGEVYQVVENVLLSVDDAVYGYDVRNKEYISTMSSKGIVDPFKVARVALESSVSIIGTLLTSNYSVINTKKEKV